MKQNRKAFLLICLIILLGFGLSRCIENHAVVSHDPRGQNFAGSASCRQCHQAIYDQYLQSSHYQSTRAAERKNIQGSFATGHNRFDFKDSTYILLEERDSGLYQSAYVRNRLGGSHPFDIVFGLKHAQTFLYWKESKTYELPISFYTAEKSWGTSPGFSASQINFDRFIGANCFECHSSFVGSRLNASVKGIEEVLDRKTLLYGIDCERCHGPALDHVNFHLSNPNTSPAEKLVRFASLSRQQKLDVCAVCHSGNNKVQEKTTFRFQPGDTLAHYFTIWPGSDTATNFDVHGNQYQLLSQSKCFLKTRTVDCSTCHNPHTDASPDLKVYSTKCLSCHQNVRHSFTEGSSLASLSNNCIDCHMPAQPSQAITFQLPGSAEKSAYQLRTHRIAIYPSHKL